jgi:hypothetical protein
MKKNVETSRPMTMAIHNKKTQQFEDLFLALQNNIMSKLQPNY